MAVIQIENVPDELHRAFKAACAVEGSTMREKILEFMRSYAEKQKKGRAKK